MTAAIVSVRGTLLETPHIKIVERDDQETEHSLARVRVTELRRGENWQPAAGEIIVTTPEPLPGQFLCRAAGGSHRRASPDRHRRWPKDFLIIAIISQRAEFITSSRPAPRTIGNCGRRALTNPPLTDRFLSWSKKTLALGLPVEDEPLRLLWAMTLGWRTAFTGDISEPFLRAGTMHLFAIDGLRIALISGMLVALAARAAGFARLVWRRRHSASSGFTPRRPAGNPPPSAPR